MMMGELLELSVIFFKIGLFSIGGGYAVIPLIREQVVGEYGWMTEKMFADIVTISQMTPGPLAVNASTFAGIRIAGLPGALAATLGCVSSGIAISVFLLKIFKKHGSSRYALEILNGLKSASSGLILSAAAAVLMMALFLGGEITIWTIDWKAVFIFAVSLILLRRARWNPILIMAASGAGGLIFYLT